MQGSMMLRPHHLDGEAWVGGGQSQMGLTFEAGAHRLWAGTSYTWQGRAGNEVRAALGIVKMALGTERRHRERNITTESTDEETAEAAGKSSRTCNGRPFARRPGIAGGEVLGWRAVFLAGWPIAACISLAWEAGRKRRFLGSVSVVQNL